MDVNPVGKGSVISWKSLDQLNGHQYMIIDNSVNDKSDLTPDSELEIRVLYVDENKEANRIYKGIWKVNHMPEGF